MTQEPQYQGVWQLEPDELKWIDEATGYSCAILRHPYLHHLCGYVGVFPWHPAYKLHYRELAAIDVHGGLTYACGELSNKTGDEWWLGFDCAHSGDLVPGLHDMLDGEYRTIEYVRNECLSLARQLKQLEVVEV